LELIGAFFSYFLIAYAIFFAPSDTQSIDFRYASDDNASAVFLVRQWNDFYTVDPPEKSGNNTLDIEFANYIIRKNPSEADSFAFIKAENTLFQLSCAEYSKKRDELIQDGRTKLTILAAPVEFKILKKHDNGSVKELKVYSGNNDIGRIMYSSEVPVLQRNSVVRKIRERKDLIDKKIAADKNLSFGVHEEKADASADTETVKKENGVSHFIAKKPFLEYGNIDRVRVHMNRNGFPAIVFDLNASGIESVSGFIRKSGGKKFVLMINGKPVIDGAFDDAAVSSKLMIQGFRSWSEAEYLAGSVNRGVESGKK
jgi:hypothetical protein